MKKNDIGQAIQVLANIGVLAGIVFLAFELRQNTRAVELTAAQGYLAGGSDLDLRIATDAELAVLLIRGDALEPTTPPEELQLESWNYAVFRQWETAYYLHSIDALDESLWLAYRHEIQKLLLRSNQTMSYWKANRGSFSSGFGQEIDLMLTEAKEE
jgi:hypothetical protein